MTTRPRTLLIAAACTLAGAGGAFGVDALSSAAHNGGHHPGQFGFARHGFMHPGFGGGLFRAVHADAVVAQQDGSFGNVTFDRGTVKSVSGQDLTVTDGTKTATYKDVTITIPSDAKIHRFGTQGTVALSDLQVGDRVAVVQAPKGTFVLAAPAGSSSRR